MVAKQLELLRELVPGAARVALFINPANPTTTETTVRDAERAARTMGLQIQFLQASTSGEIDIAFATFARERPDTASSQADVFNWFNWRPTIESRRPIPSASFPKSAG